MKKTSNFILIHPFSVVLVLCLSILVTGCSSAEKAVTSASNPDLRCKEISDYSNDKKFWNYAYKNIPTVSLAEVESGSYDDSYICVDATVLYSRELAGDYDLLAAFEYENGNYGDCSFLPDGSGKDSCMYGFKILPELKGGDMIKICAYIENGKISYYPVAIKKISGTSSLDVKKYLNDRNAAFEKQQAEAEAAAKAAKEAAKTGNPLLDADVHTDWVRTGDGSGVVGERAYIEISKTELKAVTEKQYIEFLEKIENSGMNWYSIICEDGTGITFAGCLIYLADYGTLDHEGCIVDLIGQIEYSFEDGSIAYSES